MDKSFQQQVLELTKQIPKGKVTTYKEIAKKLNSKAYRSVGSALNKNNSLIKIPCHRVINSNGYIGHYVKGQDQKENLLLKEGIEIKNKKIDLKKYLYKY